MNGMLKKRWISLYVENQIGVLSKISGLFSAKCYNLESLTVGRTEDPTISRMTIETHCDEETVWLSDKGNDSAIRLRFASLLQTRLLQIARLNRYIKTERTLEFSFKQFYTRKIR